LIVRHKVNSRIAKILKVSAITLYPFICYHDKFPGKELKQHEMIHIDQIRKNGVLKFYLLYLLEYAKNVVKYKDLNQAYFRISFEQEAYRKQHIERKDFS